MQPARTKYRKFRKVIPSNIATSGHSVSFGEYAIKAVTSGRVTGKQIETVRRILAKKSRKLEESLLESSHTCPLLKNRSVCVWVVVKVVLNSMLLPLPLER